MGKKLSGRAMVIELDSAEIRIAQVQLGASAPKIQQSSVLSTPLGAVEDGAILDPEALRGSLQAVLSAPEWLRVRKVVFSLCSTQVLSDTTTIPFMSDRQIDKMLTSNQDMYFPVDMNDYHLVWAHAGETQDESGKPAMSIRLWAVPKALLVRYYSLANELGLSVEAIDYCGNSFASSIGVSYAPSAVLRRSRKHVARHFSLTKSKRETGRRLRRKVQTPTEPQTTAASVAVAGDPEKDADFFEDTTLHLLVKPDFLLMTFVQSGQVKLQRMVQRGGSYSSELSEIQMALEFYNTTQENRYGAVQAILYGGQEYADWLEGTMGIPAQDADEQVNSEWCLCFGASHTVLDFGIPSMNQPKSAKIASQAWQYLLLLCGGLLLVGTLTVTLGSRVVWETTINGLEENRDAAQLQAAQGAGNAQRYYDYQSAYQAYSTDWDSLFSSLQTYNDNLSLMFDELEALLPTTTSVTEIGIAEEGLALQLACPTKEEAAYVLLALRYSMQYGDLNSISDLTVGPGVSALEVLPSLNQAFGEPQGQDEMPADAEGAQGEPEAPPTEGSQYDIGTLLEIMEQASQATGSTDYAVILAYALENDLISREELEDALLNLTPEQLAALEAVYGTTGTTSYTLDELLEDATAAQREEALRTMLTEDPIALYQFFQAFREDIYRPAGTEILFNYISDDIWNSDFGSAMMSGNTDSLEDVLPEVLDILTKDEATLSATERLIQTDDDLARKLAYYLALEMGLDPDPDTGSSGSSGSIDIDGLVDDIINGNLPEDDEALDDALSSLTENGLTIEDLLEIMQGQQSGNDNTPGIGDILGGLDIGNIFAPDDGAENPVESQEPADTRIYVTVTIGYSEELIQQELERKGLTYDEKLPELEVSE